LIFYVSSITSSTIGHLSSTCFTSNSKKRVLHNPTRSMFNSSFQHFLQFLNCRGGSNTFINNSCLILFYSISQPTNLPYKKRSYHFPIICNSIVKGQHLQGCHQ